MTPTRPDPRSTDPLRPSEEPRGFSEETRWLFAEVLPGWRTGWERQAFLRGLALGIALGAAVLLAWTWFR